MSENSNGTKNKTEMIGIGGLWVNKSASGEIYLTGYLNGARLLIFKNKYKESDKHPDYRMYIAKAQQRPQGGNADDFEAEQGFEEYTEDTNTPDIPF